MPILDAREGIWGIKPRNREQHFAFDALLDDRIKLVTLMGKAGTGKTLLAMAAGLKKPVQDREYRRLVVARPTISMGRELGFLPGSLEEKLDPWMQPIHDALEMLSDLNMGHEQRRTTDLHAVGHDRRRGPQLHPRPQHRQSVHRHRRGARTSPRSRSRPSSPGSATARRSSSPAIPTRSTTPTWTPPPTASTTWSASSGPSRIAAHVELQKGERSELAEHAANLL